MILPASQESTSLKIAEEHGVPVDETPFTLKELMDADEVIVCGSSKGIMAACEIDGKPVGGKDTALFDLLSGEYRKKFLKETEKK